MMHSGMTLSYHDIGTPHSLKNGKCLASLKTTVPHSQDATVMQVPRFAFWLIVAARMCALAASLGMDVCRERSDTPLSTRQPPHTRRRCDNTGMLTGSIMASKEALTLTSRGNCNRCTHSSSGSLICRLWCTKPSLYREDSFEPTILREEKTTA